MDKSYVHLQAKFELLTERVMILSNSIAGAIWKSNTKYWNRKQKKVTKNHVLKIMLRGLFLYISLNKPEEKSLTVNPAGI